MKRFKEFLIEKKQKLGGIDNDTLKSTILMMADKIILSRKFPPKEIYDIVNTGTKSKGSIKKKRTALENSFYKLNDIIEKQKIGDKVLIKSKVHSGTAGWIDLLFSGQWK